MISECITLVMLYLSRCYLQLVSMIYSGGTVILGTIFLSKELANSNSAKTAGTSFPHGILYCCYSLSIFKKLQKISLAVGNLPIT